LPEAVDDVFNELVRCASRNDVAATDSLDLDVQDELARAAEMPRIEAMFVRLTLQLRLFVTLMGLSYEYPPDVILGEDIRIIDAIRARDPDDAVTAWRSKTDSCVRYMVQHHDERPRR
jgi:DNA-binding GntR family transcriptional regulator